MIGTKDKDTIQIYENYTNLLDDNIEINFYILNKIDLSTNKKEVEINNFKNYINERYKEIEKYNFFDSYLK